VPTTDYRHRARSLALQILYELDSTSHDRTEVLSTHLENEGARPDVRRLVVRLVDGVLAHRLPLDDLIRRYAPEWPLEQLAVVDRNILRLAVYELLYEPETPVKVVINEAIELAKLFGAESTPRFVNGVLGSLVLHETELRSSQPQRAGRDDHQGSQP